MRRGFGDTRFTLQRPGFNKEIIIEGGIAYHRRVQANRDAILEQNKRLRQHGGVRTLDWGRLSHEIPDSDMPFLDSQFPGLADATHPDHRWAWRRFLASPMAAPYKVTESRRTNAGHIICN